MSHNRQYVLAGVVAFLGLLAAWVLARVLATVLFAATIAAVFTPVDDRLRDRGVPPWWAAVVTTVAAFLTAVAVLVPLVYVAWQRRTQIIDVVEGLPESVSADVFGMTFVVNAADAQMVAVDFLQGLGLRLAQAAPVLALKLTLFAFVVFSLVLARDRAYAAMMAPVPETYRDVAERLHERARETCFAIYVLQAATAAGTFVIAVVVFWLLGYEFPFTLATVAGLLQFIPVIGPSVLVIGLTAYEALVVGNLVSAAVVGIVGLVFIAYLPDVLIRPRVARISANMSGSLYFVGFTGGLLTVGTVGIIAGPLVVSLLSEAGRLLAAETNGSGS